MTKHCVGAIYESQVTKTNFVKITPFLQWNAMCLLGYVDQVFAKHLSSLFNIQVCYACNICCPLQKHEKLCYFDKMCFVT